MCFISAFITLNFATEPIGNNRCKQGLRLFVIYEQSLQSSATAVPQLFGENRPPQFTPLLWLCTLGIQQMATFFTDHRPPETMELLSFSLFVALFLSLHCGPLFFLSLSLLHLNTETARPTLKARSICLGNDLFFFPMEKASMSDGFLNFRRKFKNLSDIDSFSIRN